ncbi:hypothetical protein C1638_022110, partial [Chryseobacterium oncorhynchi]
ITTGGSGFGEASATCSVADTAPRARPLPTFRSSMRTQTGVAVRASFQWMAQVALLLIPGPHQNP